MSDTSFGSKRLVYTNISFNNDLLIFELLKNSPDVTVGIIDEHSKLFQQQVKHLRRS